jgi:hypothetical protein
MNLFDAKTDVQIESGSSFTNTAVGNNESLFLCVVRDSVLSHKLIPT